MLSDCKFQAVAEEMHSLGFVWSECPYIVLSEHRGSADLPRDLAQSSVLHRIDSHVELICSASTENPRMLVKPIAIDI
jgi:hypothetical protein